jgi:hypothetical protein
VAAVLVLLGALLSGCSHDAAAPKAKAAPPTPIAELNTSAMALPRVTFCTRVPKVAVRSALGTAKWRLAQYKDGDRTAVEGGTDTVAEDGCAWAADDGSALARAWVFAPPADTQLARQVVRDARTHQGCRLVHGPAFGDPSLTQVCTLATGVRVRHAGLFGTTWLSCEISDSAPAPVVRKRADAWCVQIANTLNTAR